MKKAMFVTGGTVGTGLCIAETFAKAGYAVFITSRDEARAQEAAAAVAEKYGVHAKGYGLDVGNEDRVKEIKNGDFNDLIEALMQKPIEELKELYNTREIEK